MADDILKQAEDILDRKEWEEFWWQYQEAVEKEDWGRAHSQLVKTLIPKLFENHNKMVEAVKVREELINKYKELTEISAKTIKHYEEIIKEYESRA